MNPRRLLIAFFYILFLSCMAFGQEAGVTGFPSFAPIASGPDNLNLATLNAHFRFPIMNKAGRGLPFSFAMNYDTTPTWALGAAAGRDAWGWANEDFGPNGGFSIEPFGYIMYSLSNGCSGDGNATNYSNWIYIDAAGTVHQFPSTLFVSTDPVCFPTQATQAATDNSGFVLTASSNGPTATVKDASGNTYNVPVLNVTQGIYGTLTGPASMTDRNGNTISTDGHSSFTDTVGTAGVVSYSPVVDVWEGSYYYVGKVVYVYKTVGNGGDPVTVNYKLYRGIDTQFGCGGDVLLGNNNPGIAMVNSIVYEDGSQYSFTYEQTNPALVPGYITGRLASITLPTGGTISYNYGGDGSGTVNCADGTPLNMTRTTQDGTWTYARTISGTSSTTTVTDPMGNQTVYTFQNGYPVEKQVYQGSVSGGTLLQTTTTCYNGTTSNCNTAAATAPITQETVFLQLPNGQESERNYVVDPVSGATTEEDDYDFGAGTPGALLKTTLTQLAPLGNNILGKPQSITIKDGSGNQVAQTTYGYDETAPTATSGLPQHSAISGARGNLTSVHRWLNTTGGTLTTTNAYDDAGQVLSTTDPNNNTTSFSYSCSDAYSSKVTLPNTSVAHITSAVYDCYTGLKTSDTDQNNQATSYSYDQLLRPIQTNYPDGGQTTVSYPSATEQIVQSKINGSNSTATYTLLDGLGRVSRTATANGESLPYDQQDTCYNADGEVGFRSYVYQGWGFSHSMVCSGAGDSYAYDALGRQTQLTHSDGTSVQYTQETRNVQITEEGNGSFNPSRILKMDALGRTVATCEISSTLFLGNGATPASCGFDLAGSGFLTTYTYDAFGNTTSVAQGALNPRTYTYDSLSRLVSTSDPESGTTTYAYDNNGNALTRTAPLENQTNPATTVTTSYTYDALNRVTQTSYNDGVTPTAHFAYDTSSGWGGVTQNNVIGRMSEAWATNSTNTMFAGQVFGYDPMGRTTVNNQCTPLNCGSSNNAVSYTYDLAGDMLTNTNGEGVTFNYNYNLAQRLTTLTSSLNDANHPGTLFSNAHYSPAQATDSLGNGLADTIAFTSRGLVSSEIVEQTGVVANTSDSTGSVTINGTLQTKPAKQATGSVTIVGGPDQCRQFSVGANGTAIICDQGTISVKVNGTCTGSVSYSGTSSSSPSTSSLASSLASSLNSNCSSSISASISQSNSSVVILTATTAGSSGNSISLSTSVTWLTQVQGQPAYSSPSYSGSVSGSTLSGGQNGATDHGSCTITVNSHNDSYSWSGSSTTAASIAGGLVSAIKGDTNAVVNASQTGLSTVVLTSKQANATYPFSSSCTYDSADFPGPSFTTSDTGANSNTQMALPVYWYSLNQAPDGRITGVSDLVNGNWALAYDSLNHLASGNKNSGQATFSDAYDVYGNRWQQNASQGISPQYTFDNNNRISGSGVTYDAAGNMLTDGIGNTFTWDAEGRLVQAVNASGTSNYVYDALSHRVQGPNGYYLYDLNHRAITQINSTGGWVYGEIYAGNRHLATYSSGTTSFIHTDWLGNKRVTTGINGAAVQTCTGGTLGDSLSCNGTSTTPYMFTDDLHDAETGLEHTMFRQYSSTQGRWLIPDPAGMAVGDVSNPQSWNRYAYVTNDPSNFVDRLGLVLGPPPDDGGDNGVEDNDLLWFGGHFRDCYTLGGAQQDCDIDKYIRDLVGEGGGGSAGGNGGFGLAFGFQQGNKQADTQPKIPSCSSLHTQLKAFDKQQEEWLLDFTHDALKTLGKEELAAVTIGCIGGAVRGGPIGCAEMAAHWAGDAALVWGVSEGGVYVAHAVPTLIKYWQLSFGECQ